MSQRIYSLFVCLFIFDVTLTRSICFLFYVQLFCSVHALRMCYSEKCVSEGLFSRWVCSATLAARMRTATASSSTKHTQKPKNDRNTSTNQKYAMNTTTHKWSGVSRSVSYLRLSERNMRCVYMNQEPVSVHFIQEHCIPSVRTSVCVVRVCVCV